MRGEFEIIARYFAPLATRAPGAFGLRDDAAVVPAPDGEDLVVTVDTITSGVHFLPDDPADQVSQKLLRVNLSDLAAMGARPVGYLLSMALDKGAEEDWVARFAEGLAADQSAYGLDLLGGDTTAVAGSTTLSLTAIGAVPGGSALRRNGAGAGDGLYVSGTIGDGALGLRVLTGRVEVDEGDRAFLVERYRRPQPRLALGRALLEEGLASAVIDVSDGLVADAGHICAGSGLAAEVRADAVPLSAAAQRLVAGDEGHLATALTGGDDYELLFTVPGHRESEVAGLAARLDLPLARIGRMTAGEGVRVLGAQGRPITFTRAGWTHL